MESLTSGTFVGEVRFAAAAATTYHAFRIGHTHGLPECAGQDFERASLFSTSAYPPTPGATRREGPSPEPRPSTTTRWLARREKDRPGGGVPCYEAAARSHRGAQRGVDSPSVRSLAADVRFDDPTSRARHALIVRQPDGVRVLDDRSLNGVFVNGSRIEGKVLKDGDEIIIGRYR